VKGIEKERAAYCYHDCSDQEQRVSSPKHKPSALTGIQHGLAMLSTPLRQSVRAGYRARGYRRLLASDFIITARHPASVTHITVRCEVLARSAGYALSRTEYHRGGVKVDRYSR
jgi:hypothetical protein